MASTTTHSGTPARALDLSDPGAQAFTLLRVGFTAAPILFGLDKFFDVMVDWPTYLWSGFDAIIPGSANDAMLLVGVIEIVAGILVAVRPKIGGYVVAVWLGGIIVNLLAAGGFLDIALRDFGLLLGALTLARLATVYGPSARPARAGQ
ncbi:MAG: hypothetical protein WD250_03855 [Egibacteraceae bacterium]